MTALAIESLIKIALLIGGLMTAAAYFVLLERRMAAWIQDRRGPNRVGIPLTRIRLWGLGQPLADGVKFITKEEYTPAHVDKRLYILAPIVILVAALAAFAVVPFGSVLPENLGIAGASEPIHLVAAPGMNVALLYIFALSSIAVYGVILGGWASNNKYSFLGGLRSSAQLIAYELPLGLGILGVVLASGSLDLEVIIGRQANSVWFAFSQPLGLMVFVVAAFAEAARLPFDLPECEQELIGGYHTEYAGLKLLFFLVAEFLHMIIASMLIVILFFGGWHFWGLTGPNVNEVTGWGTQTSVLVWLECLVRVGVLSVKVFLVILFFMVVRWSWPRFRFDQLMALAWKVMLPLGLVNLCAVGVLNELRASLDPQGTNIAITALSIVISWVVCGAAWFIVSWAGPRIADNRPRHELESFEIDTQV